MRWDKSIAITTFDIGVCMKADPLIWKESDMCQKHVILIGTFPLTCAHIHMIGKKMESCGLTGVLLEAGLVGSGTVYGVLSGKNYSRAMVIRTVELVVPASQVLQGTIQITRYDFSPHMSGPNTWLQYWQWQTCTHIHQYRKPRSKEVSSM